MYPETLAELQKHVQVGFISGCGDEWARDYMPVPTRPKEGVQFRFDPAYLKPRQFQHLRTNVAMLEYPTEFSVTSHPIVLDGGNVVSDGKLAILTEQVRKDNPDLQLAALISELTRVLKVEQVMLIPWLPGDWTRHADGMVSLVDGIALVQDFSRESLSFQRNIQRALARIPYPKVVLPSHPNPGDSAIGVYVNLITPRPDLLIMPSYGIPQDVEAEAILRRTFPSRRVVSIPCQQPALEGGAIRCLSWVPIA